MTNVNLHESLCQEYAGARLLNTAVENALAYAAAVGLRLGKIRGRPCWPASTPGSRAPVP